MPPAGASTGYSERGRHSRSIRPPSYRCPPKKSNHTPSGSHAVTLDRRRVGSMGVVMGQTISVGPKRYWFFTS